MTRIVTRSYESRAEYRREGWTRFDERAGPYAWPAWSEVS
jgi:hypothetical protein